MRRVQEQGEALGLRYSSCKFVSNDSPKETWLLQRGKKNKLNQTKPNQNREGTYIKRKGGRPKAKEK